MTSVLNRSYKLKKSPVDERDYLHAPAPVVNLPTKIDLRPEMPAVLDQSTLGSCCLQATSNALKHLLMCEKIPVFQPSRLYLYWNTRVNIEHSPADEDTGVCIRDVCKSLSKYHACDETFWPYDISKFSEAPPLAAYQNANLHKQVRYAYVPLDANVIKTTLAHHLPIIIGIQVYESFESQKVAQSGLVPLPDTTSEQCLGGHSMLLCGYDDDTQLFTVMNSWSANSWGDQGYCYIPYKYLLDPSLASDYWVISFFS